MRDRSRNIYYKQNINLLTDNGQVPASSKQQQINVTHRYSKIRRQKKTQLKEKFGLCDFCWSYIVIAGAWLSSGLFSEGNNSYCCKLIG